MEQNICFLIYLLKQYLTKQLIYLFFVLVTWWIWIWIKFHVGWYWLKKICDLRYINGFTKWCFVDILKLPKIKNITSPMTNNRLTCLETKQDKGPISVNNPTYNNKKWFLYTGMNLFCSIFKKCKIHMIMVVHRY